MDGGPDGPPRSMNLIPGLRDLPLPLRLIYLLCGKGSEIGAGAAVEALSERGVFGE